MIRQLAAGLALVALTACSSVGDSFEKMRHASEANPAPCPNVFALSDAARMIEFDGDPSLQTVAWSAEIVDVRTTCRYFADSPIDAQVEIDFAVGRGPAADLAEHSVTYFVAVTRRNRALIAKEEFTVPVRIKDNIGTVTFTESIGNIEIPRRSETTNGTNFEIAIGFSLTRDQVLFNRSGESLQYPEL